MLSNSSFSSGAIFLLSTYGSDVFTAWLVSNRTVSVDDSLNLFNLDCKVRAGPRFIASYLAAALAVTFARFLMVLISQYRQHTTSGSSVQGAQACLRELRRLVQPRVRGPTWSASALCARNPVLEADDIWLSPGYGQRMCWIGINTVQVRHHCSTPPARGTCSSFSYFDRFCRAGRMDWMCPTGAV